MGDVHSRRSPPFPSPTETLPPAVPQSHHMQPLRSPGHRPPHGHQSQKLVDELAGRVDALEKSSLQPSRLSRGDSTEKVIGLTPITEDARSEAERQEDQGRSSHTLKELRKQMEDLLVYQQMQQTQPHPSQSQPVSTFSNDTARKRRLSNTLSNTSTEAPAPIMHTSAGSAGSAGTIKGVQTETPSDRKPAHTPSYPFPHIPHIQNKQTKMAVEPIARGGPFRLKLPSEKSQSPTPTSQTLPEPKASEPRPTFLPAHHNQIQEDPNFVSPNLYDLTLQLNADSGLEAWWSNLIDILQTHYGAERVSLAVPGDVTDLENVPWGQKAIFNQNVDTSLHELQARHMEKGPSTEQPQLRKNVTQQKTETVFQQAKMPGPSRPSLLSRHSFAGFDKNKSHTPHDPNQPQVSKINVKSEKKHVHIASPNPPCTDHLMGENSEDKHDTIDSLLGSMRQAVFPVPRPLEVELDPLIKRTGVVRLFGRTRPTILTREYTESAQHPQRWTESADSPNEMVQITPDADGPGDRGIGSVPMQQGLGVSGWKQYDEYEQIPQSPWSQSPAPSPAPRTHAEHNPFFTNHSVDEGAFSKDPPSHDYSNNLPLEAIGIDQSKTVIHIPLLHGGHSDRDSSSTLRFPVAVVSMLCTIVPYPPNLRQSLSFLMPHLTTSFCLAQRYSQLERQLSSKVETPRYGHLLGLGGTFSDASSELELVAGLSGHVSYSVGDNNNSMSAHTSITSPSDHSSVKFSPAVSAMGTPGFDLGHIGFGSANQSPGVASRSGGEAADSYFNVPQNKNARDNASQNRPRLLKSKTTNIDSSTPISPDKVAWKPATNDDNNLHDQPFYVASPLQDTRPPNVLSPTQQSSRQASTNSLYAQLQRELPRPFTDTIAQLMLNSIPLHLFLAKPQSGEVIWTNSKFDAYRRSQHQEQKFRDPWQNIHSSESEHVHIKWANALRTGAQFTERVRVRRFNDESAYRWFIFRANPLLSSTGEVLYWIGSFLDIHEQHIAELEAIQEREKFAIDAKYRAFSNSIPQVVFEATENRGLIFVNEQWNLYTGQPLEEAHDLGFAKHVHPDDLEKCGELSLNKTSPNADQHKNDSGPFEFMVGSALDELVRRGIASLQQDENGRVFYSTEIRLRSRGGDFRWHLVRVVRVKTSSFGSEEASWYGTCTDINDRKNLERELNKAMQQLNHQMESKTKFFSNMSHEIRTPLNGILGTIPFILDTQLDSDQRRMLDTIQNSSTNLRELVDNILDVSRVEAGKMSMVKSWFHIRSMIEDVIDTIASRAIDKGLEINYLIGEDLPSMVIGDRFRIRQVLINLLGNAVKFTAQGEIHICCDMYRDPSANPNDTQAFMNFEVVDTGKGFSSQDAERLMQRFSQLGENGTQQHAGSGLGLFLSKQLVEMHGGKLTPSSKEGQGAKFSFNVKVDAPTPPSPSEQPKLMRQNSTASRRPANSRTTSYQQAPPLAPRNSDSSGKSSDTTLSASSITSSALPTPDIGPAPLSLPLEQTTALGNMPDAVSNPRVQPAVPRPDTQGGVVSPTSQASASSDTPIGPASVPVHGPFSIVILCPLKNSRQAIKQHIEQVVPHEISFKVTTLVDVDEWKDAMHSASDAQPCTHIVLNLPTDDILEVIQHMSEPALDPAPVIVIIADLYQKRQISSRVKQLAASGKQVFIVPKPVKPSAFSSIFDPKSKRELSKDRNQDMAREINNNFKTVSKMVKEVLGNKGYRILLVEDDETNRDVMLKYLDKIKLMSETASNGLECTNMVLSKEPGYYSLIICDIQMPIKNGYDTCRDIRDWEQKNHYPQIPIMALSANAMTDQIENAARAGFNDYVTKPIKHNELGKMMMGLLEPGRPLMLLRDRLNPDRLNPEQQQPIATRR